MTNFERACLASWVTDITQGSILRPLVSTRAISQRNRAMYRHREVCRSISPTSPPDAQATSAAGQVWPYRRVLGATGLASTCVCVGRIDWWLGRGDRSTCSDCRPPFLPEWLALGTPSFYIICLILVAPDHHHIAGVLGLLVAIYGFFWPLYTSRHAYYYFYSDGRRIIIPSQQRVTSVYRCHFMRDL